MSNVSAEYLNIYILKIIYLVSFLIPTVHRDSFDLS